MEYNLVASQPAFDVEAVAATGALARHIQELGRRAGGVLLAGTAVLSLTGCGSNSTAESGVVLGMTSDTIKLGACTRIEGGFWREDQEHLLNAGPEKIEKDIKNQTSCKVTLRIGAGTVCETPRKSFAETLKRGDFIHMVNDKEYSDKERQMVDHCVWKRERKKN